MNGGAASIIALASGDMLEHNSIVPLAELIERLPTARGEVFTSLDTFGVVTDNIPFVEPMLRSYEIEASPKVTFVSARGASGKSTMASYLSQKLQAPLWALADDAAVSGDALPARLSAYLHTASPLSETHHVPVLILDALDEARLRVTGLSWDQFLTSLVEYAGSGVHMVMLGRKRTVEDAWIEFADAGVSVQWYEISHFDEDRQKVYVDLRALGTQPTEFGSAYTDARDMVLADLNGARGGGLDDTFAGYAPVLDAVAALLKPPANYQTIQNRYSDLRTSFVSRVQVLRCILDTLLTREAEEKVSALARDLGLPTDQAFTPDEQLDWLSSELLGLAPPTLGWCPQEKRPEYVKQLRTFLGQHPYRHDDGWASPVFSSYVAFRRFDSVPGKYLTALASQSGLLFDFHVEAQASGEPLVINQDQFTALHRSLVAGQWHSSTSMVAVRSQDSPDMQAEIAEVLFTLIHEDSLPLELSAEFLLDTPDELSLTSPLSNLDVTVSGVVTISSPTASIDLGPDVYVCADHVRLSGSSLQISKESGADASAGPNVELAARSVFEADLELIGNVSMHDLLVSVPLAVSLPYPWVTYRGELDEPDESDTYDMRSRRFLNKLLSLTRRDGHGGRRAVFIKKLEGRQGLKSELFTAALDVLESHGVVAVENDMIFYSDQWESNRFDGKGRPGLPSYEDMRAVWDPILQEISNALE